jgi:hypothetical protein
VGDAANACAGIDMENRHAPFARLSDEELKLSATLRSGLFNCAIEALAA